MFCVLGSLSRRHFASLLTCILWSLILYLLLSFVGCAGPVAVCRQHSCSKQGLPCCSAQPPPWGSFSSRAQAPVAAAQARAGQLWLARLRAWRLQELWGVGSVLVAASSEAQAQQLWCAVLVVLQHVESSRLGTEPVSPHWQVPSCPLHHQGSPDLHFLNM